ncbi:TNF receptor-associated factor homolog 1a-like [Amaranthus tricolor]|uniref:TNF receptor-associated factor homolog 1a-like n=1 Tax=Amaranthus tricolor TaxID=29722 RepID=UPI00258FB5C7|nr:TNF receptor-associated factor homolog 1a-like [Amaranthus tricolor]XP_057547958.1 TNF receptor-associated factor homolog 1a-like [Amaranthus tricolor]XP_057547959.1 TNF receptor-associated factor homolog 1a-like [Amaranthus tricolor]
MAAIVTDDPAGASSLEGLSSAQHQSSEVTEWRSSDQVESCTPSTSPPYWDTDSDDDGGPKPADLYDRFTWKIDKFSEINKRELRSDTFEVGGYKWYILIYPQGCDVCNHLSLFLCVANHDKLLPGWSHFAQFTIAVVNKDPKKSKYSDTLHRFWKKEHDWGWKKFMELSKVSEGFVEQDTLIIKAQVQVIRERAERPFRCLDCQYRRELVRVYLTNVEQICRRFVEERRGKLGKLIEDKARWSSFCAFWLGMDQNTRRRMSREKKEMILKVVVKNFFIDKEVTSTLVMDSLYSGLKALEGQSKSKKGKGKFLEGEATPAPIVRVEKDVFILVDDVVLLLERAAMEPLPPKDDKGPQNRTKEGGNGEEFHKESIERDERRLTELGRRTVEIFVLAHIFSNKIEVAYQEAVSLKRQEELIREEEAAWLAENEKAKRGTGEKDKKSKKRQGKQKRNARKGKDKLKDDKLTVVAQDKPLHEEPGAGMKDLVVPETVADKDDAVKYESDMFDSAECAVNMLRPDVEDRDASPINWDTGTAEIHPTPDARGSEISSITMQNGAADRRSSSIMDDSSSTCSTDSAPSVIINGSYRSNSSPNYKSQKSSPSRGKQQQSKGTWTSEDHSGLNEANTRPSEPTEVGFWKDASPSHQAVESNESEGTVTLLQDRTKWPELNAVKKEQDVALFQKKPIKKENKDHFDVSTEEKVVIASHSSKSPPRNATSSPSVHSNFNVKLTSHSELVLPKRLSSNGQQSDKETSNVSCYTATLSKPGSTKSTILKPMDRHTGQLAGGLSRPSSAPLIPGTFPTVPVVSMVQVTSSSAHMLSRSISAAGRLGPDPSLAAAHPYVPQSYRNAIMGNSFSKSSPGFTHPSQPANAVVNAAFSQQSTLLHNPVFFSSASDRLEPNIISSCVPFTPPQDESLGQPWMENPQIDADKSVMYDSLTMHNGISNFDMYRPIHSVHRMPHELFPSELSTGTSGRQVQSALADEFPYLDIINDLLDDEKVTGKTPHGSHIFEGLESGPTLFNRQLSYPTDISPLSEASSLGSLCRFDRSRSHHDDGFQQDYGASSPYDSVREFIPQDNPTMPYINGQIDGAVANQWQLMGPDLSLLSMRSSGMDGYSYSSISEYSNIPCGVNGYSMFRPSNGH